jgi:outer membrane protein TolC
MAGALVVPTTARAQETPPPSPGPPAEEKPLPPPAPPAAGEAAPAVPAEEPSLPAEATTPPAELVGPTPGARTMSLGEAVAIALEHNFSLLSSADQWRDAQLGYSVAVAEFFPKLTPRYTRADDDTSFGMLATQRLPWTGATILADAGFATRLDALAPLPRSSNLRLEVSQPLLRGFGPNASFYDLRNSRRAREGSERSLELRRQQVALDVAQAYYEIVQQRALMAVARQSGSRSEALQRSSEARLQVGLVSKLDVFRAQLQTAQAQEAVVRAETALGDALERFRFLLGMAPTEPVEPEAAALPARVDDVPEPIEVLIERAKANRLDLMETRDLVGDAQRTASLARQNLLPQLDLKLGITETGLGPGFGDAWRNADRAYHFGIVTTYPIRIAEDRAAKASADIRLGSSQRNHRERELEIESEVRRSVRELGEIRKSAELQTKAVEVAQQQHRLATLRFQRGLASNFDVVEAEGSLLLARSALVGLLTRYQVARVRLLKATGSLDVNRDFAAPGAPAP